MPTSSQPTPWPSDQQLISSTRTRVTPSRQGGFYTSQAINSTIFNVNPMTDSIATSVYENVYSLPATDIPENQPWPAGSVIKWNMNIPEIKAHIKQLRGNTKDILVRFSRYTSHGNIFNLQWMGNAEPNGGEYETKYFIDASPEEVNQFNEAYNKLNLCTTMPSVGTVVVNKGNDRNTKNNIGVVNEQYYGDTILVKWLTGPLSGSVYESKFNIFSISDDQSKSFVPNPSKYCKCSKCTSIFLNKLTTVKFVGSYYCSGRCATDSGKDYCRNCSKWQSAEQLVQSTHGKICGDCATSIFRSCAECESLTYIPSLNSRGICEHCRTANGKIIHSYDYKPIPSYNKMAWENTRYLGIELEIEASDEDDKDDIADKIQTWAKQRGTLLHNTKKNISRSIYLKNDGSLQNGIEIVFHPFTLKSLHHNFPIKEFLQFLKEHDATITSRCGMHVHVSKDRLSKAQLIKGKWFFFQCAQFLKKFSERNTFDYCKFEGKPTNDPYRQEYGRRTALNVAASQNTLEIRMFQGTLEYDKFMANLQFSDAFVDYIQNGPGGAFLRTHTPHQIWQDFIDYCKKDGQYQIMTNWILRKGIV